MRFAIVVSRFNTEITDGLLNGALAFLEEQGIGSRDVTRYQAPGAFETPLIAQQLAGLTDAGGARRYAGVICLGAVIKGETAHFEYISGAASQGIMQAMLSTGTPIAFGILTTYTEEQALARSRKDAHNKGREAAAACLETARTLAALK